MATAIIVHLLWIKMEGGCEQIFWKRVNIRPTLAVQGCPSWSDCIFLAIFVMCAFWGELVFATLMVRNGFNIK